MTIVYILRHRNPKRTCCTRNGKTEMVIYISTRLRSERESAKDKINTIPFQAKKSPRQRMEQHMLIATFIIKRGLKMSRKNIPGQVRKVVKLKRVVFNPQIKNRSSWHKRGWEGPNGGKLLNLLRQPCPKPQVPQRLPKRREYQ